MSVVRLVREAEPALRADGGGSIVNITSRIENLVEAAVERGEFDSDEAGMEARGESIPVGRVGDPMELGDTVAYLCSDRAGYINGESVVVDGGSTKSNL
jgi:3-oxoacyl-[acyl-carrier protein] reductase